MDHTEYSLLKLSQDQLAILVRYYQGKFDFVLQSLRDDVSKIKSKFNVMECELQVSKSVTDNLTKYIKTCIVNAKKMSNTGGGNAWKYQAFLKVLKIPFLKTLF